ncbi:MAG: lasso peptide biosynthesis B2 protein [Pseudomonadota bacterium]
MSGVSLQKLRQLSAAQMATLPLVTLMLGLARFLTLYVPFRWWRGWITIATSDPLNGAPAPPGSEIPPEIHGVGRIVRMAARHVPFDAVCLPQAMAAQWWLARKGWDSQIVIGVDKTRKPDQEPGKLHDLHAWLVCDGHIVTGRAEYSRFRPFTRPSSG